MGEEHVALALPDAEGAAGLRVHVGLGDRDAVDQALPVLLGGEHRGAAAVGHAGGDDDGVARGEPAALVVVPAAAREAVVLEVVLGAEPVQDREGELDRLQHVAAPVGLGVALRMRVLVGEAVRRLGVEGGQRPVAQPGPEGRVPPGLPGRHALALDQVDGIVLQVVRAVARPLVGVGHGAAVPETPLAGGADGAVDAARARGGRGHDAGRSRVEAVGHLDHEGHVLAAPRPAGVGQAFEPGDPAFGPGVIALGVDVGAEEGAVAAAGIDRHQGPVVVEDRQRPQLRRRRRVGQGRRRACEPQARGAQAGGQQVVGDAVILGADDLALDEARRLRLGGLERKGRHHRNGGGRGCRCFHGLVLPAVVRLPSNTLSLCRARGGPVEKRLGVAVQLVGEDSQAPGRPCSAFVSGVVPASQHPPLSCPDLIPGSLSKAKPAASIVPPAPWITGSSPVMTVEKAAG